MVKTQNLKITNYNIKHEKTTWLTHNNDDSYSNPEVYFLYFSISRLEKKKRNSLENDEER